MSMGPVDPRQPDDLHSASTDSDLMNAAKRMDPVAWGNLVDRYSKLLFQWCRSSGLDVDNSADVVQVVLGQIAIYLPDFKKDGKPASFRRWLRTLAHTKIADFHRASANQPRGQGGAVGQAIIAAVPAADPAPASGPDPAVGRFWQLVERLEDQFEASTWQAFWLTTVESRTSKEVAELLKMTPNSVRLAKARVLRKLRAEAAKPPDGNPAADD